MPDFMKKLLALQGSRKVILSALSSVLTLIFTAVLLGVNKWLELGFTPFELAMVAAVPAAGLAVTFGAVILGIAVEDAAAIQKGLGRFGAADDVTTTPTAKGGTTYRPPAPPRSPYLVFAGIWIILGATQMCCTVHQRDPETIRLVSSAITQREADFSLALATIHESADRERRCENKGLHAPVTATAQVATGLEIRNASSIGHLQAIKFREEQKHDGSSR